MEPILEPVLGAVFRVSLGVILEPVLEPVFEPVLGAVLEPVFPVPALARTCTPSRHAVLGPTRSRGPQSDLGTQALAAACVDHRQCSWPTWHGQAVHVCAPNVINWLMLWGRRLCLAGDERPPTGAPGPIGAPCRAVAAVAPQSGLSPWCAGVLATLAPDRGRSFTRALGA